jgi:hypothetical protein
VPDHPAANLTDERQLQCVRGTKCLDDEMFCLLTVGVILEGCDVDVAYRIEVP